MTEKYLSKLFSLALFVAVSALADTNTASDEVAPADSPGAYGVDISNYGSDKLQPDPLIKNLPTEDAEIALLPVVKSEGSSNDLWQRIQSGYAMADLQSPFVSVHEAWYAARPDYVKRMVNRSQKYLYHIVEEVEKRGMPTEIALLPMVESAFNPQAYSRSRASGIWQFIPSTGKSFGLKQNWWVDNRRDVMAATDAALNYLEKLHVMFGTWELALAAYNAGEGTVQRAINYNRRKGLPTDYQSLRLPPETKNYVPKLMAVKNIVTNPEQYGLDIQPIADQPYFTKVSAPKQIDARLAAKLAGISTDEFSSLNPAYNRPVLASNGEAQEILLPVGADEAFSTNLANYDKPLVSWQTYYAKRGEPQESIARKFGISLSQLRDVNDLPSRSKLRNPRVLLVPANASTSGNTPLAVDDTTAVSSADDAAAAKANQTRHVVKKGESIDSIAKRHGMSTRQLLALNRLDHGRLKRGQVLAVKAYVSKKSGTGHKVAKKASGKTRYLVRRGETLASIARKFNVATADLQRWNNLSSDRIIPGHKLTIYKPDAA